MSIEINKLERLESLANESIRTAIGAVMGTTMSDRAKEAHDELCAAIVQTFGHPQTLLNFLREYHQGRVGG